ncbi:hypothetical protein A2U01_0077708 [Trifolium medium]|uniref:Uncharacterized protein n=1 Tax=Trifolium medium TaxID=97028 RepID=A0A392T7S2_9FABA|nr:hypothetical protein [Trifolium medium]
MSLFWWSRGVLDSPLSVLDQCVFFVVVVVATDLRWGCGGCDGSEMGLNKNSLTVNLDESQ